MGSHSNKYPEIWTNERMNKHSENEAQRQCITHKCYEEGKNKLM